MKKLKRHAKKLIPALAILGGVVILAAVFRAVSIVRNAGTDGIQVPNESFMRYVWLELKQAFKFSRYE